MKTFITILLTAALAATATWFIKDRFSTSSPSPAASGERKVLYYQSAMHPWIKSDKPGRCTICGMELTPVYEGEQGFDASGGGDVVALTQNQIQVLHVETAEAKVQPISKTLKVAGMMDDNERRHRIISAYVDGRVDRLFANHHGVEVVAGKPLALIYSPSLLQAEREYRQLTGELKSNTALRLRQMGLTEEQIRALPEKPDNVLHSEILAPLSGTVVDHNLYEGQYVTAGEKLFEIADFSTMWFMFRAYEQDMPWVKTGQRVTVTTPSLPGRTFEGKVTFIDPNFDEKTRSTKVRVELPNPLVDGRRELLHRLYAEGIVEVDAPAVLSVPRSAVIETGSEAVVYVDQGSGAYLRTVVSLGRRGDQLLEVLSGLNNGAKVVTNGNLLIDGQAEMNRSFMTPAAKPAGAGEAVALDETQRKAITDLVAAADAMAKALGDDDLAAFTRSSEPVMALTAAMTEKLQTTMVPRDKLEALNDARHFHGFDDIKSARVAFHKFSTALTEVMEPLRASPEAPKIEIWECSMVNQAIPGAPKKGHWVQTGGRPGLNPFFGKEMADCASEIKP